tara:strand:+ start:4483 stop:5424 length:942 start_codon:yes stop_codon:yes gene_type:complete
MSSFDISIQPHDFQGGVISSYRMDDFTGFRATKIAERIGYEDPRTVGRCVVRDWADEFIEGVDFMYAEGALLKAVKSQVADSATCEISPKARKVMFLSESGVNLVCMFSKKEAGVQMRRWIASDVMPALRRTGKYEVRQAPAPQQIPEDPKLMRERRLAAREQRLDRESKSKHLLMITAELGADLAPEVVRALKVQAVEIATGLKLPQLCAEDAENWYTAEQLLEPHDLHPNSLKGVLNLIKKEAGLTLRGDRTYMRTATTSVSTGDGGQKTVKQTQWTDEGKAIIDKWAPVYARRKDMKLLPKEPLSLQPSA